MSREELAEILCDYIMSIEDVGTLQYVPKLISFMNLVVFHVHSNKTLIVSSQMIDL